MQLPRGTPGPARLRGAASSADQSNHSFAESCHHPTDLRRLQPSCSTALTGRQLGNFLIKQPWEFLQPGPALGRATSSAAAAGAGAAQAAVASAGAAAGTSPQSRSFCSAQRHWQGPGTADPARLLSLARIWTTALGFRANL